MASECCMCAVGACSASTRLALRDQACSAVLWQAQYCDKTGTARRRAIQGLSSSTVQRMKSCPKVSSANVLALPSWGVGGSCGVRCCGDRETCICPGSRRGVACGVWEGGPAPGCSMQGASHVAALPCKTLWSVRHMAALLLLHASCGCQGSLLLHTLLSPSWRCVARLLQPCTLAACARGSSHQSLAVLGTL